MAVKTAEMKVVHLELQMVEKRVDYLVVQLAEMKVELLVWMMAVLKGEHWAVHLVVRTAANSAWTTAGQLAAYLD